MSRSKVAVAEPALEDETVLQKEGEAVTDNVGEEPSKPVVEPEVQPEPKIGVVRFLQLHPQNKMVEDLMKSLYRTEVHTESEWLEIKDTLLGKTVRTGR